ncbi:MAG: hypothetical protein RSB41_02630 [Bacilli bacterium]
MLKIVCKVPLLNDPLTPYSSGVYKKDLFVFTSPLENKIINYSLCEKEECFICVSSSYNSITKDTCNNTFFASVLNDKNHIYKLNSMYDEIDCIKLKVPEALISNINSIYYRKKENKIYICTHKNIYSVSEKGTFIEKEISSEATKEILGIPPINYTFDVCCNKVPICTNNKNKFTTFSIFCGKKVVAYTKNNSSYIAFISDNGNIIKNYYIEDDIIINSIINVKGRMFLIITKCNKYNYIYITDIRCCKSKCHKKCHKKCKRKCCKTKIYEECICSKKCHHHYTVVESIALIEAALSHILNAEGEKIQKIIAISTDPCELLKVNESVNRVIKNITFLEHVLYEKLELASNCHEECDK